MDASFIKSWWVLFMARTSFSLPRNAFRDMVQSTMSPFLFFLFFVSSKDFKPSANLSDVAVQNMDSCVMFGGNHMIWHDSVPMCNLFGLAIMFPHSHNVTTANPTSKTSSAIPIERQN